MAGNPGRQSNHSKNVTTALSPVDIYGQNSAPPEYDDVYAQVTPRAVTAITVKEETAHPSGTAAITTWTQFTQDTTFHGVRYIFESSDFGIRRPLWALCVMAAIGLFTTQVYTRTNDFFGRESSVGIEVIYNDTVKFPSITLCNLNNFRITEVATRGVYETIDEIYSKGISKVYQNESDYQNYKAQLAEVDVDDFIVATSHQLDDFFERCFLNGQSCDRQTNFTRVLTDGGVCFTFNSGSADQTFHATTAGAGQSLNVVINVEQYEYMKGPQAVCGVKVLLHDQNEAPLMNDLGFSVSPGVHSLVSIQRVETHNLEPPYGHCDAVASFYTNCTAENREEFAATACSCTEMAMDGQGAYRECNLAEELICIPMEKQNYAGVSRTADSETGCLIPCDLTAFNPTLSYAQLSKFNIERTALRDTDGRDAQIKERFETAREITQRYVREKWLSDVTILSTFSRDTDDVVALAGQMVSGWNSTSHVSTEYQFGADPVTEILSHSEDAANSLLQLLTDVYSNNLNNLTSVIDTDVTVPGSFPVEFRKTLNTIDALFSVHLEPDGMDLISVLQSCQQPSFSGFSNIIPSRSTGFNGASRSANAEDSSSDNFWTNLSFLSAGTIASTLTDHEVPNMSTIDGSTCREYVQAQLKTMKTLAYSADRTMFDDSTILKDVYDQFINSTYNRGAFSSDSTTSDENCRMHLEELDNGGPTALSILGGLEQVFGEDLDGLINILTGLVAEYKTTPIVGGWPVVRAIFSQCTTWHDITASIYDATNSITANLVTIQQYSDSAVSSLEAVHQNIIDIEYSMESVVVPIAAQVDAYLLGNITKAALSAVFDNTTLTTGLVDISGKSLSLQTQYTNFQNQLSQLKSSVAYFWEAVVALEPSFYPIQQSAFWGAFVSNSSHPDMRTLEKQFTSNSGDAGNAMASIIDLLFQPYFDDLEMQCRDLNSLISTSFAVSASAAVDDLKAYKTDGEMNNQFYSDNFLKIDFYYKDLSYTKIQHQVSFTLFSLLSEVGGFLGLLLGASVLTVCEIIDYFILAMVRCLRTRNSVKSSHQ